MDSVTLKVVFSRRGGTDYHSMRDYLCLMRDGKEKVAPVRAIDWTVLDPDNIDVQNHSNPCRVTDRGHHYERDFFLRLSRTPSATRSLDTRWNSRDGSAALMAE